MTDQVLDILVRFGLKDDAAKQAASELAQLKQGTEKATAATHEHAKATNLLGSEHRVLHKLFHQVAEASPIMGIAIRAAISPIGAVMAGVTAVWHYFNEQLKETNKLLDEMEAKSAEPIGEMKDSLFEANKAVAESRIELEKWHQSMNDGFKKLTDLYDHAITKIHEQTKAVNELIDAEEKAGIISPQSAAAQKTTLSNQSLQKEISVRQNELDTITRKKVDLDKQERAAEARELDVKNRAREISKGKTEQQLRDEAKDLSKSDELKKAKEEAEKKRTFLERQERFGMGTAGDREAYRRDTVIPAEEKVQGIQDRIKHLEKAAEAVQRQNIELAKEKAQRDELRSEITKTTAAIKQLKDQLEDLRSKADIEKAGQRRQEAFQRVQNSPLGGAAIADLTRAEGISDQFVAGKGRSVPASDTQILLSVASEIAGKKVTLSQAIQMMEAAKKNQDIFTNDVLRLTEAMRDIMTALPKINATTNWVVNEVKALKARIYVQKP